MTAPSELTLASAAHALSNRTISSRELVEDSLRVTKAINPKINAFLRIDEELALSQAAVADLERERGHIRGPLHGIPFGAKDMFHRAAAHSSYGAKIDLPLPETTSTVLARLDAAGAIQMGVLNMTAFAVGPTGHNRTTGNCCNPWDPSRITGGSSSGSGAAVAARTIYGALGSDTAGSVRIPAGLCGVTGLKPTYGRVSRAGSMGFSFTLDVVGPLARTAEDCAILMNAIAGPDVADPTSVSSAPPDYLKGLRDPVRGLRLGVFAPETLAPIDDDLVAALEHAKAAFEELGCELVPLGLPDLEMYDAAAGIVLASEGSALHAQLIRDQGQSYGNQMRIRLERGFAVPAPNYIDALRYRGVGMQRFSVDMFSETDAILLPLTAIRTPRLEDSDIESGANIDEVVRQLTRFTRPINFLGLPALAIPAGFDGEGMPMSMQLVGRALSEDLLLRLGHAYQSISSWHKRRPPVLTDARQAA